MVFCDRSNRMSHAHRRSSLTRKNARRAQVVSSTLETELWFEANLKIAAKLASLQSLWQWIKTHTALVLGSTPLQSLWQWIKTHTALVLGAFIAIVGLLVWYSAQDRGVFGTTGGIILVDSPEVF